MAEIRLGRIIPRAWNISTNPATFVGSLDIMGLMI
jgi:hypothetical protein